MRLHLEDAREPIADVDHAGVLARPLDHMGALGRQTAQMQAGGLVGAVLVPHRRDDAELGEGRRAVDELDETGVFVWFQSMRDRQRLVDFRLVSVQRRLSLTCGEVRPRNSPGRRGSQAPQVPSRAAREREMGWGNGLRRPPRQSGRSPSSGRDAANFSPRRGAKGPYRLPNSRSMSESLSST